MTPEQLNENENIRLAGEGCLYNHPIPSKAAFFNAPNKPKVKLQML